MLGGFALIGYMHLSWFKYFIVRNGDVAFQVMKLKLTCYYVTCLFMQVVVDARGRERERERERA